METLTERLAGVCHIMITPFDQNEAVDHESLANVVRDVRSAGASAIVPLGIMGESHKLLDAERQAVLETVVAESGDDLAVVAGVTSESTFVAVHRTLQAEAAGADAVMVAPPRNSSAGPGLLAHYRAIAEASSLPVVVQDEPVTTNVKMPGAFFAELATIPGIAAAKVEEVPSPQKVSIIRKAAPEIAVFGGLGGMSFFEELERGADGIMTGFGFPRILVDIDNAYRRGDRDEARAIFYKYMPIIRFEAQLGVGGVAIRKNVFFERGVIKTPIVRSPTVAMDAQTVVELRELIDAMGLS